MYNVDKLSADPLELGLDACLSQIGFPSKGLDGQEKQRVESCFNFFKNGSIPHKISLKAETVGCEGAAIARRKVDTGDIGIDLCQETKGYVVKKKNCFEVYFSTADYDMVCPKHSSQADLGFYGIVPFTVSPATVCEMLVPRLLAEGKKVSVFCNPSIKNTKTVYNNYGSRNITVSCNGAQLFDAIRQRCEQLGVHFGDDLAKFKPNSFHHNADKAGLNFAGHGINNNLDLRRCNARGIAGLTFGDYGRISIFDEDDHDEAVKTRSTGVAGLVFGDHGRHRSVSCSADRGEPDVQGGEAQKLLLRRRSSECADKSFGGTSW